MYFIKDNISVTLSPSSTSVVYGSDAVLTATITSEVAVDPVTWQKVPSDGNPVNLVLSGKYTQASGADGSFILTIRNTNKTDEGTYQVKVTNAASKTITSNTVSVTVTGGKYTEYFFYKYRYI